MKAFKSICIYSILMFWAFQSVAQVPQQINYQGNLTDAAGVSINATLNIEFKIYDSEILTATPLWSETQSVAVVDGSFNVLLGASDPANKIPLNIFDGTIKYLGIKVAADPEMTPRKKLVSVGYSFRAYDADKIDGKDASDFMQKLDGVAPNSSGNVDLVAGSNVSIIPDVAGRKITISATPGGSGGDITSVNAADGLTGGGTAGDVLLNVGAGTGITVNADDVALNSAYTDGLYVNENQINSITATMIKDGEVKEGDLKSGAVTTPKIKDNAVTTAKVAPNIVSSIENVSNDGGNIDLIGNGITITPNDGANSITFAASSSGDNLGNHTATQNIKLNNKWLSGDGGNEGVYVRSDGKVGIGISNPGQQLDVGGTVQMTGFRISSGAGSGKVLTSNGSGYGSWQAPVGDDLGNHTASRIVELNNNWLSNDGGDEGLSVENNGDINMSNNLNVSKAIDSNNYIDALKYLIAGDGSYQYGVKGMGSLYGVFGYGGTCGLYATGTSYGVCGKVDNDHFGYLGGSSLGGYIKGNFQIDGNLTKSGGAFKIDHPLDPANKYLQHSFVESPDMMNIYNGIIILDSNGEASVELPAWFEALNKDVRYQLTPIGAPGPNLYIAEEITGNIFKISGGKAGMKVSWQVTGIRQDPWAKTNPIIVEKEKQGKERGKYLYPELYGMSKTQSINYEDIEKLEKQTEEIKNERNRN